MAEYDVDKMVSIEVNHIRYGKGIVAGVEGNCMSIDFGDLGIKKFQYPDAFEKFLSANNEKIEARILSDLEIRKEDDEYINRKKSQEVYDNVKEFGKRKAAEHERKLKLQLEKQRQAQMMREQRMQNGNNRNFNSQK